MLTFPVSVGAALRSTFLRRCFFGQVCNGALTLCMRCVGRLRKRRLAWSTFPRLIRPLRKRPAEVLRCASGPSRFYFRQLCRGFVSIGIPRHLTIRSSRPHVVASATCFALRLHASAAPPRVGLTQALGANEFSRTAGRKT
jgi:hypothetical protein